MPRPLLISIVIALISATGIIGFVFLREQQAEQRKASLSQEIQEQIAEQEQQRRERLREQAGSTGEDLHEPDEQISTDTVHEGQEQASSSADTYNSASTKYNGRLLAGSTEHAPYLEFDKEDYEAALKSNKTILLVFYSSWCTLCRQEEPILFRRFQALTEQNLNPDRLIAFRVNYEDEETDEYEKDLAAKHYVLVQPAKVILKPGRTPERVYGMWGENQSQDEFSYLLTEQ
ncbi:MAG: thioredoxin family protein [Patescibacteria group bacterium]